MFRYTYSPSFKRHQGPYTCPMSFKGKASKNIASVIPVWWVKVRCTSNANMRLKLQTILLLCEDLCTWQSHHLSPRVILLGWLGQAMAYSLRATDTVINRHAQDASSVHGGPTTTGDLTNRAPDNNLQAFYSPFHNILKVIFHTFSPCH